MTVVAYSSRHQTTLVDPVEPDIDGDSTFVEYLDLCRPYSMVSKDALYALYKAIEYVCLRGIPGDFVECGVWKGGASLMAALAFRRFGGGDRRLFLYDTFEGMTAPTEVDVDISGMDATSYIRDFGDDGKWCYHDLAPVEELFERHGFHEQTHFIKGDVLETLDRPDVPEQIAVLRLDTDWYESTLKELNALYPRIPTGGVLYVDDYGWWRGARKAVDEYFHAHPAPYLHRVNVAARLAIKI